MARLLLRIRTKDGTERLSVDGSTTLGGLQDAIAVQFQVPVEQQLLSRSVQAGPTTRKGEAFTSAQNHATLAALGLAAGDIVFLDYQMERENQAQNKAYANDPFRSLVREGELRQQGQSQWTLTNFLDYRSTKEFKLEAPPEPHCKFVQVDPMASQTFINFMVQCGFQCKRLGILYGKWAEDEAGQPGVHVHAIYEPKQDSSADAIVLQEDAESEEKLAALSQMLGLHRVGVMIAHPARQYAFSVNEIILASKMHAEALKADPEKGKYFVTMKARPVLQEEENIEGYATMEAYQMTDQSVELCGRDAFSESNTDPRVAKTSKDCCFIVEKKEQRKATMEFFTARVFDISRPFKSFLGSGFPVENRPTEPQTSHSMAAYLRQRRDRRPPDPFVRTVSDLHFLLFLCNVLDMKADMPVLCNKVVEGSGELDEGFQLMINCYAGL